MIKQLAFVIIFFAATSCNVSAQNVFSDNTVVEVQQLEAQLMASYKATEAGQGAAADASYFYAIVNTVIGKYDKSTGDLVKRWTGARTGPIRHLNSCFEESGRLLCANSNFPEVPMASSIEVFDTDSMNHASSYSFGVMEEGSLTWFERLGEGWIAGFAHYAGGGGLSYKDHSFSSIARYDQNWQRRGGWMIADGVIERMDPYAASGGAIGLDGLLYLTGHDRKEMYVLAAPKMGPKLVHIATIAIDIEGQAFAWDKSSEQRIVYGISRPNREVRAFRLPTVTIPEEVYPITSPQVLQPNL